MTVDHSKESPMRPDALKRWHLTSAIEEAMRLFYTCGQHNTPLTEADIDGIQARVHELSEQCRAAVRRQAQWEPREVRS